MPGSEKTLQTAGLYVHVPYCLRKCTYCAFYSITRPIRIPEMIDAMIFEAELRSKPFPPFDTLYIGGGTPSLLGGADLHRLISGIKAAARLDPYAEITVEANPDDAGAGLFEAYRAAGVNRISLGVQSFDDRMLCFLGRRHTAAQAEDSIEAARKAGFSSISVDIISGLPRMRPRDLTAALERALHYSCEHISCYQLGVEPRTPLHRLVSSHEVSLPSERSCSRQLMSASDLLTEAGYDHYEVSNFARTPSLRSRHNVKYWTRAPYLGLGPAAHSFDGERRCWNVRSVKRYLALAAANRSVTSGSELLSPKQIRLEKIMLGLRWAGGVPLSTVLLAPASPCVVDRLVSRGLVLIEEETLRPTRRGYLVADGIARMLA